MNMIEKVARAINARQQMSAYGEIIIEWDNNTEKTKRITKEFAKAAIEAMREPTEEMILCAKGLRYDVEHIANYRKIIDAALKE